MLAVALTAGLLTVWAWSAVVAWLLLGHSIVAVAQVVMIHLVVVVTLFLWAYLIVVVAQLVVVHSTWACPRDLVCAP